MGRHPTIITSLAAYTVLGISIVSAQSVSLPVLLELMTDTAAKICQAVPLEQANSGIELNGDAKAKLDGLLSKLVELGLTGAAKYNNSSSKGVLQKDLATAVSDGNKCRLDVFKTLQKALLGKTQLPSNLETVRPSVVVSGLDPSENVLGREYIVPVTVPPNGFVHFGVGYLRDGQTVRICLPTKLEGQPTDSLLDFWLVASDGFDLASQPRVGEFHTINGACTLDTSLGLPKESKAIIAAKHILVMRQSPNGLIGLFNKAIGSKITEAFDLKLSLGVRRN